MSRLLVGIPNAEREAAEAALAGCATVALREGASRAAARIPACALLVVEEGLVEVASHRAGATRRMVVAVAGPGAVLLRPERDERLEALGDAWLTAVSHEALSALLQLPGAAAALLEALAEAARERQESLASFSSVRHVERVRDKLLQLARAHGRVVSGGVRLDIPLTARAPRRDDRLRARDRDLGGRRAPARGLPRAGRPRLPAARRARGARVLTREAQTHPARRV